MKKLFVTAMAIMMLGSSITANAACSHPNNRTSTVYDHRLETFTESHMHDKTIVINGKNVVMTYICTVTKERAVYKTSCHKCGAVAYDVRVNTLSHSVN